MDMTSSSRRFTYVSTLVTWILGLNCVPRHYSSNGLSPQRRMRSLLSARSEGNLILLRVTAMSLSKKLAVVAASLKAWLVSGHIFSLSINILTLYLAGLLFRKNVTIRPYIFFCCFWSNIVTSGIGSCWTKPRISGTRILGSLAVSPIWMRLIDGVLRGMLFLSLRNYS